MQVDTSVSDRQTGLQLSERIRFMRSLGEIARETGKRVMAMKVSDISDTVQVSGHQFSTVDSQASVVMRQLIDTHLGATMRILEESDMPRGGFKNDVAQYPLVVCDAVEGSTNAKRGLANPLSCHANRPIHAGTAIMLLEAEKLGSIAATAFYDWNTGKLFTSVRGEHGSFLAFIDNQIVYQEEATRIIRDSQIYTFVPGYSHSNIRERASIEEALLKVGIRTMGGTRSSAQDLLDVLFGNADAYVDLRYRFSGSTQNPDEVLRAWDVGALLAFLDALGFVITDESQRSWQECRYSDSMSLVVARHGELAKRIKGCLAPLPFMSGAEHDDSDVVTFPTPSLLSSAKGG